MRVDKISLPATTWIKVINTMLNERKLRKEIKKYCMTCVTLENRHN